MSCCSCFANMHANFQISKFPNYLNNSLCRWQMHVERVPFDSHADGFCKGFEYGFDFMVFIFAMTGDIQVTSRCIREGFKEMKEHFRRHIPHFVSLEMRIPYDPVSSAEIQ